LITQQDLLSSLDALQSLSVQADPGDIQAYKSIIRAEGMTLTTEFARPDLPRPARVRVLLGGLLGWSFPEDRFSPTFGLVGPPTTVGRQTGDVEALLFLLNLGRPVVASGPVDQQVALQAVVRADTVRLLQLWIAFQFVNDIPDDHDRRVPSMWPGIDNRPAGVGGLTAVQIAVDDPNSLPPVTGTFSDRLIRANLLLPVIAEDSARVAGALDAAHGIRQYVLLAGRSERGGRAVWTRGSWTVSGSRS